MIVIRLLTSSCALVTTGKRTRHFSNGFNFIEHCSIQLWGAKLLCTLENTRKVMKSWVNITDPDYHSTGWSNAFTCKSVWSSKPHVYYPHCSHDISYGTCWESLIEHLDISSLTGAIIVPDYGSWSLMIISFILRTCMFDHVVILKGEVTRWSLLGVNICTQFRWNRKPGDKIFVIIQAWTLFELQWPLRLPVRAVLYSGANEVNS